MTPREPQDARPPLALIAALPRELAQLSRDLGAREVLDQDRVRVAAARCEGGLCPVLLVTAGMGAGRVALAVAAALARGPLCALVSVGLAGACDPNRTPASGAAFASLVIDSRSGERYQADSAFAAGPATVLVTAPEIAGVAEKRRLRQAYRADLVDMEAATVARLARAHGIPFGAIKAVSDEHNVDLTRLSAFADRRGQFRTAAFAAHTILHPGTWRATTALGRDGKTALTALTSALHQLIDRQPSGVA